MVPIILPKSGALEMGGAGHGPGMGSPRDDVDDDGGYAFVLHGFASFCVLFWFFCCVGQRASVAVACFLPENITHMLQSI